VNFLALFIALKVQKSGIWH